MVVHGGGYYIRHLPPHSAKLTYDRLPLIPFVTLFATNHLLASLIFIEDVVVDTVVVPGVCWTMDLNLGYSLGIDR